MSIERQPFDPATVMSGNSSSSIGTTGSTKIITSYKSSETSDDKRIKSIDTIAKSLEDKEPETTTSETSSAPETPKKDAWKRAHEMERKAQEKEKQAKAEIAKVKEFQDFVEQAKKDPTVLAKAMGMSTQEFYSKYTNQMYGIPEETKPEVKETTEQRLDRIEQARIQDYQSNATREYERARKDYVSNKIIPALNDPDRFELIHKNGKEQLAENMYDIMNAYYTETFDKSTGKGIELDPIEVAEAMEARLTKETEDKIKIYKETKKFSALFSKEEKSQSKKTIAGTSEIKKINESSTSSLQERQNIKERREDKRARILKLLELKDH